MRQEIRELHGAFCDHAGRYALRYLEWLMGERATPPLRPAGLHADVAKAIRDVVSDQAIVVGACGARLR